MAWPHNTILVTRPQPDADRLAERIRSMGYDALVAPVMEIHVLRGVIAELTNILAAQPQAVLVTSANGVRALAELSDMRDMQIIAVGQASAEEARKLGFHKVVSAAGEIGGDVQQLVQYSIRHCEPNHGPLLHIAGNVQAGDLVGKLRKAGYVAERLVAYEAVAVGKLPSRVEQAIVAGQVGLAMFYSPRTARLFLQLVKESGCDDALINIQALALSPAVADALSEAQWQKVMVAAHMTEAAMLEMVECD